MCIGPLAPKMPSMPAPQRQAPPPTQKAAAPPPEYVPPEDLKDKDDEEKISTKRKKELEIEKQKKGVKEFGSVDPENLPKSPDQGVNIPK